MLDNLVTQRNAAIGVSAGKLVWEGAVVFTYATTDALWVVGAHLQLVKRQSFRTGCKLSLYMIQKIT